MFYRSIAEFEAEATPTAAERALIAACRAGEPCILGDGTLPDAPHPSGADPTRTIRAALLRLLIVGGTTECGLHPSGVWVIGAYVPDKLDLSFETGKGACRLENCRFTMEPQLAQTHLPQLAFNGSHLPGLFAPGCVIAGSMFLRNLTATGTVDVNGAKIGGQLVCEGATIDGADKMALNAQGVETSTDMFLGGLTATGTVDITGAKIGGILAFTGATLNGAEGVAMYAQRVETGAGIILAGLNAMGTVYMNGAKIGGQLVFVGATLNGVGRDALMAQGLTVKGALFFRQLKCATGRVDMSSVQVGDLVDDMAAWPHVKGDLTLAGFTYDRISGAAPVTLAARRDWLRRGSNADTQFNPQPYTQFAKVLRGMGNAPEARKVLYERDCLLADSTFRNIRKNPEGTPYLPFEKPVIDLRSGFHLLADGLSRWVIGYGHKPWRSLIALTGLFAFAFWLAQCTWTEGSFAPNSDIVMTSQDWTLISSLDCIGGLPEGYAEPCIQNPADRWSAKAAPGMDWDSFNAAAYAADLVIPILDLGQTDAWAPSKDRGPMGWWLWWLRWPLAASGWLVTALGVAAITGIMQRNSPEG